MSEQIFSIHIHSEKKEKPKRIRYSRVFNINSRNYRYMMNSTSFGSFDVSFRTNFLLKFNIGTLHLRLVRVSLPIILTRKGFNMSLPPVQWNHYTQIDLQRFDLQGLGLKHFGKIRVTRAEDVSGKGFLKPLFHNRKCQKISWFTNYFENKPSVVSSIHTKLLGFSI